METTEPEPKVREVLHHVTALDGVRGLAVAMVVCNHLLMSNSVVNGRVAQGFVNVIGAGWVGVDLFFALSGFLITGILYDSLHDRRYFQNFYMRRVLRIFPLYYGVLALLFVLFFRSARSLRPLYLCLAYLTNTGLWYNHPHVRLLSDLTGHLWSLAVEEQFYLVWPLLVFAIRDRRRLVWTCVALSLGALASRLWLLHHGASVEATYKLTVCRADSLLSGAWLALIVRGNRREQVLQLAPAAFLAGAAACFAIAWKGGGFNWQQNWWVNAYGYSALAVASTALLAMALNGSSLVAKCMRLKVMRFLGTYSYGIYVYHPLLAALVWWLLAPQLQAHLHSKALFHLSVLLIAGGSAVLLAVLSFKFYEQPFLRMKRFFNYRAPEEQTVAPMAATLSR